MLSSRYRGLAKLAQEYAPGIQDKNVYGNPLGTLRSGQLVDWVLQHHKTRRNPRVPHYDLRLGTPETNLFSWAVPKAELPGSGESRPVFQTQLHTHQYGGFEGPIEHGYGAGHVTQADKGKALITKVGPNTIHFSLAHQKVPTRYVLIHVKGRDGKTWLLMAQPEPGKIEGVGDKPIYKQIHADDQESAMAQATQLQEKIDGAHGIVNVGPKGDVDIYSVRPSVTGAPIRHTERMGISGIRVPPRFKGTSARGEMYFTSKGRAIPFKDVSGVLNSGLQRSIETQQQKGLTPQVALFDVVGNGPRKVRQDRLAELMAHLPAEQFHLPQTAETPEAKQQLFEDIRAGRNPRTTEGVMAVMPDESVRKIKNKQEQTGYLTGTYPGKRPGAIGGLAYSLKPGGPPVGRVGTGFSNKELQDIVQNLETNMGKPIRIEGMGQFGSGKMRAPSFKGFETDKPGTKQAQLMQQAAKLYNAATPVIRTGKALNHATEAAEGLGQNAQQLGGAMQTGMGAAATKAMNIAGSTHSMVHSGLEATEGVANLASKAAPAAANLAGKVAPMAEAAGKWAKPLSAITTGVDAARTIADPKGSMNDVQGRLQGYGGGAQDIGKALWNNVGVAQARPIATTAAGARAVGQLYGANQEAGQAAANTQQITDRAVGRGLTLGAMRNQATAPLNTSFASQGLGGGMGGTNVPGASAPTTSSMLPSAKSLSSAGAATPAATKVGAVLSRLQLRNLRELIETARTPAETAHYEGLLARHHAESRIPKTDRAIRQKYSKGFGQADHARAAEKISMVKAAIIEQRGKGYVLLSHKGKVLGSHPSREAALRQERAVQANKHAAAPVGPALMNAIRGAPGQARRLVGRAAPAANQLLADIHPHNPNWDPANPLNILPVNPAQVATHGLQLAEKHLGILDYLQQALRQKTLKPLPKDQYFGDLNHDFFKESQAAVKLAFLSQEGQLKGACTIEIADTPQLRRQGLQHRRFLPEDHGMFFDKAGSYWMKDVHFPLDIVFTDPQGKILDKQAMMVNPRGDIIYTAACPAAHAVELPLGWCSRHGVEVGDQIQVAS